MPSTSTSLRIEMFPRDDCYGIQAYADCCLIQFYRVLCSLLGYSILPHHYDRYQQQHRRRQSFYRHMPLVIKSLPLTKSRRCSSTVIRHCRVLRCPMSTVKQSTSVPVQHASVCSSHHLCPCCVPSDRVELLPIHVHMHPSDNSTSSIFHLPSSS